jgi:hypothetical protein
MVRSAGFARVRRALAVLLVVMASMVIAQSSDVVSAPTPAAADDGWVAVPSEGRAFQFRRSYTDANGNTRYECTYVQHQIIDVAGLGIDIDTFINGEVRWAGDTPGNSFSYRNGAGSFWQFRIQSSSVFQNPLSQATGWAPERTFWPRGTYSVITEIGTSPLEGSLAPDCEGRHIKPFRTGTVLVPSAIFNRPPEASFTFTISDPATREVIFSNFSDDPDGDALSFEWSFGDGSTSTARGPSHRFPFGAPTYQVTLRATDPGGLSSEVSQTVEFTTPRGLEVNSVGDGSATDPATKGCDTGGTVDDQPECTLRAAIQTATAKGGGTITFAIPGGGLPTIVPASPLPAIATGMTIDGTTQPGGWVSVQASGSSALSLTGGTTTIEGLAIGGTPIGVTLSGGADHVLRGNRIGTNAAGTSSNASGAGVAVTAATGVTIEDNVIGGRLGVLSGTSASALTIERNRIGLTTAGTTALGTPEAGVIVGGPNAVIDGNRTWGTLGGIFVIGAEASGAKVEDNRAGLTAAGTPIEGTGSAIRIDGAPGATVAGNVVWAGGPGAVLVSGSEQFTVSGEPDDQRISFDPPSDDVGDDDATGGTTTVSGNTIGLGGAGATIGSGIIGWAGAANLTISGNTVLGATEPAVRIAGGSQQRITGNVLGTSAAPVAHGIRVNGADGVTVGSAGSGNAIVTSGDAVALEDVRGTARVEGSSITSTGTGTGVRIEGPATASLISNTITGARQGISVPGAAATITGNQVSGGEAGIVAPGPRTTVQGNAVSDQSEVAIVATGAGSSVRSNVAVRSGLGIQVGGAGSRAEENLVGITVAGATEGNLGVGIDATSGDLTIARNQVVRSTGVAIRVAPIAEAELRGNRIWGTTTNLSIQAPGAPAAPELVAVVRSGSGATLRRTLVLGGLPAGDAGRIEVFANDTCSEPEARYLVDIVRTKEADETFRIIQVRERPNRDHFTVTYTDASGSTSELSTCVSGTIYPDADGDGSVDPLDDLVGSGGAGDPTRAVLPTDEEQLLVVSVAPEDPGTGQGGGRLENLTVVDDPAPDSHPAGWSLPYGALSFRVSGLAPGARTSVTLAAAFGSSPIAGSSYWKYGPPTPGAAPEWFDFALEDATGTGATLTDTQDIPGIGIRRAFTLWLGDGLRGDADGGANGTITDPGGPVIFDGVVSPEPPVTTPPQPTMPAPAPGGPAGPGSDDGPSTGDGTLARTGVPAGTWAGIAAGLLGLGLALLWLTDRRRSIGPSSVARSSARQSGP